MRAVGKRNGASPKLTVSIPRLRGLSRGSGSGGGDSSVLLDRSLGDGLDVDVALGVHYEDHALERRESRGQLGAGDDEGRYDGESDGSGGHRL